MISYRKTELNIYHIIISGPEPPKFWPAGIATLAGGEGIAFAADDGVEALGIGTGLDAGGPKFSEAISRRKLKFLASQAKRNDDLQQTTLSIGY